MNNLQSTFFLLYFKEYWLYILGFAQSVCFEIFIGSKTITSSILQNKPQRRNKWKDDFTLVYAYYGCK